MDETTRLIRDATRRPASGRRTVNPAIERGTTLLNARAKDLRDPASGPVYGIEGSGGHAALEAALADLEGAERAFVVGTGLLAVTVPLLAVLKPGDEVLATDACYWPSRRFMERTLTRLGASVRYHPAEATTDEIIDGLGPATRLLLMESPGTATFELQDVPALAAACRGRGVVSLVDNTWAAGRWFKPLAHGADISVQALSKHVGGHSDVFGGSIAARDPALIRRLHETIEDLGLYVSPDDVFLLLRGLRTMAVRMDAQQAAAQRVAEWLMTQPQVSRVLWPALESFPQHALWRRDFTGASGLMGVVMRPGPDAAAEAMLDALELFGLGFSWGGYESLATFESPQVRLRQSPPQLEGPLIRLQIGLEHTDDLIADLSAGLAAFEAVDPY
ncbi:cystathionine beta-lyase [Brevundimonas sp. 2R-24]|uniref:Cystathionine beta-lyase n=1 Tax=Peiella sedimenti TaxID=3061083 RepID=A0ABT8SJG9_9CAUL|nr:cystathionine beta-lyase [Caulobacteraceae bacterium XZ-24]